MSGAGAGLNRSVFGAMIGCGVRNPAWLPNQPEGDEMPVLYPDAETRRPESSRPAVALPTMWEDDGVFVDGEVRVRVPDRAEPSVPRTLRDKLAADERERRDHIRRWARMMIVHLERADFYAPQDGYVETLERLRELLQDEIDTVRAAEAR